MKVAKFSGAQKAFILKQCNDGAPVAEICRNVRIRRRPILVGIRSTMGCCRRNTAEAARGREREVEEAGC